MAAVAVVATAVAVAVAAAMGAVEATGATAAASKVDLKAACALELTQVDPEGGVP